MEPVPEDLGEVVLTRERREDLRLLYDNVGETRNADVTIRWYISAVMFTLNAALLPFGLDRAIKGEFLGALIGSTEVVIALSWFFLEWRMEGVIQYWNGRLVTIEETLQLLIRVFGGEVYRAEVSGVWIRTHHILTLVIMFFSFWGVLTVAFSFTDVSRTSSVLQLEVSSSMQDKLETRVQRLEGRIEELQEQMIVLSRKVSSVSESGKKTLRPRKRVGR